MNGYRLGQTLILPEATRPDRIGAVLAGLGFTPAPTHLETAPFIAGEPEILNWSWGGVLPVVHYRFNPVVRLRILDVATVPPDLRAAIAEPLAPLAAQSIRHRLASPDERTRLYGLWAAVETERLDLTAAIEAMAGREKGLLAEEARDAYAYLERLAAARLQILAGARQIALAAFEVLRGLGSPRAARALAPDAGACALLFEPPVAEAIADALARTPGPSALAPPERVEDVAACPAGALRWPNELSDKFPGGYRRIAGWMRPGFVWLSWSGAEPDGGRRRFDGLAFAGDRWVLIPRPYRLVAPMALAAAVRDAHPDA